MRALKYFLVFLFVCLPTFSQNQNDETILAHYNFNGNANDLSGNNNHGEVIGATLIQDRFGNENSAYSFDGVDDFIHLGSSQLLKPNFPISVSVWVKINQHNGAAIFNNNFEENITSGIWLNFNLEGYPAINFGNGGSIGVNNRRTFIGNKKVQTDEWTHIVGIINNANDMELFINGEKLNGTYYGNATQVYYSNSPSVVGKNDASSIYPPSYLQGDIDDLKLFNKSLTSDDVASLYIEKNLINLPKIKVLSPNGNNNLVAGTLTKIEWESENIDYLRLEYSINGGQTWNTISDYVNSSDSVYYWNLPNVETANCLIKVSDYYNSENFDISDSNFAIYFQEVENKQVAYYPFNNNANDESGNGIHGTVYGATLISDRFNNENSAFSFDGIDDFIDLGNHSLLKPGYPHTMSISAWVKVDEHNGGAIFTNNYEENRHSGIWLNFSEEGYPAINYGDFLGTTSSNRKTLLGETRIEEGKWYHIVGIVNNLDSMKIFVNSVECNGVVTGYTNELDYGINSAKIGVKDGSTSYPASYFNGVIDDVSVYNYELSEAEIYSVYNENNWAEERILELTALKQEKTVPSDTLLTITWNSKNVEKVRIEYSNDLGSSWKTLAYNIPADTKEFNIYTEDLEIDNYLIKISNEVDLSIFDISALISLEEMVYSGELFASYSFNRTTNDESEYENHGIRVNHSTTSFNFSEDRNEYSRSALDFVEDRWLKIKNEETNLKIDFPITVSVWIKKSDISKANIINTGFSETHNYGVYLDFNNENKVEFGFGNGEYSGYSSSFRKVVTKEVIETNQWNHIVGKIYNYDDLRIYINNRRVDVNRHGLAESISYNNEDIFIGKSWDKKNNKPIYFNGSMDDLKIFNYAITKNEIDYLFSDNNDPYMPYLQFEYPGGEETFYWGDTLKFKWRSDDIQYINIYYSTDNTETWDTLVTKVPAEKGFYNWIVSDLEHDFIYLYIESTFNPNIADICPPIQITQYPLKTHSLYVNKEEQLSILNHKPEFTFRFIGKNGEEQTGYEIQCSSDSTFAIIDLWNSDLVKSDTTKIVYDGKELIDGLTFFTRVRTESNGLISNWQLIKCRMNSLPGVPNLISPINGDNSENLEFVYSREKDNEQNEVTYELLVDSHKDFTLPYDYSVKVSSMSDTLMAIFNFDYNENQMHYWKMRAFDGFEYSEYSKVDSFIVNNHKEYPKNFDLISPENGSVVADSTINFSWFNSFDSDPKDSVTYNIKIGSDSLMTDIIYEQSDIIDSTLSLNLNFDNKDFYWLIEAIDKDSLITNSEIFKFSVLITDIENINEIISNHKLYNNYPNPFNPTTKVKFAIPELSYVSLVVYNSLGERITVLADNNYEQGIHEFHWNATGLPSGIYLIKMMAKGVSSNKNFTDVKKAILMK